MSRKHGVRKFLTIVLGVTALLYINAETDLISNLGEHLHALEARAPEFTAMIERGSAYVSDLTDLIPSPSELIAYIKNEPLPIDPADVAVNAYIKNSPMLSFYPNSNLCVKMTAANELRIFGVSGSKERSHLIVRLSCAGDDKLEQYSISVNSDGEFDKTIKIPDCDDSLITVDVYAGAKAYGEFTSWVYNYLYIERGGDGWQLWRSPVYAHNEELYSLDRSISDALKSTASIQSSDPKIISLATAVTADCEDDYDKLRAIHDWVCKNIAYDTDSLNSERTYPYAATAVLENESAVCLGYSTLTAALCRAVGIPCNVVSGYALGVGEDTEWTAATAATSEQNHAWNEAYVNGRWVILDTTWDCAKKIEDGVLREGEFSHLYFDANLDFFSNNHKIIEYMRKP